MDVGESIFSGLTKIAEAGIILVVFLQFLRLVDFVLKQVSKGE